MIRHALNYAQIETTNATEIFKQVNLVELVVGGLLLFLILWLRVKRQILSPKRLKANQDHVKNNLMFSLQSELVSSKQTINILNDQLYEMRRQNRALQDRLHTAQQQNHLLTNRLSDIK